MAELPQDVKQMIDAFQAAESMEPALEAKVLERLQTRVAAGEMGPDLPDKVGSAGLGATTKAVIIALVVVVPVAVLALRGQPESTTPSAEVVATSPKVEEPPAPATTTPAPAEPRAVATPPRH